MPTLTSVNAQWTNGIAVADADLRRINAGGFVGDGSALGSRGGIVRHGDNSLLVTVNGSDQITVQPGVVAIPSSIALGGVYLAAFGTITGPGSGTAIATRNATNPRIDLVIADISSGVARIRTVDGTPSSSPVAPSLPAGAVELARITVPATGGGAVTVDSTWRSYTAALGGTLYVETMARLPGSGNQKGQRAVALDTGLDYAFMGGAWVASRGPAGVLGYAQVTTGQSGITAAVDLTGLSVAVTVGPARRIRVTGSVRMNGTTVEDSMFMSIREGSTQLQVAEATVRSTFATLERSVILTPSAGAHTYKLAGARNAGSGSIALSAAADFPAFILVEDIGQA